nr:reverse transcriptase domain-containing protein [Tanacetum cinerariifolium]
MFQQTLDRNVRGWFEHLPAGSIDEWEKLRKQFTTRFYTRRACFKDPTEITKTVRNENETLVAFKERWTVETGFILDVSEIMEISSFMDAYKCPELAKQYSNKVPKTMDEMIVRLDDFVNMDDPNVTMEEYIRLEEEKARRRAIAFNDEVSSEKTLSCEPMVSSLNDETEFRISFDDSDDEDYT